ncbi:MAG: hypothetical protein KAJ44_01235 [Thermoplasmatales archaeon]|nr:hypothetical protein [Thermoplasmatales archaeon]
MPRIKLCKDCVFFEYVDIPKTLSLVEGHCKLLEMINNKPIAKCSGFEECIANEDLHTSEDEIQDDQKKVFDQYYSLRTELLKKLYDVFEKIYEYDEFDELNDFDEYKEIVGLNNIEGNEEKFEKVKGKLGKLSIQVKRYFYTVKDIEYPKKW